MKPGIPISAIIPPSVAIPSMPFRFGKIAFLRRQSMVSSKTFCNFAPAKPNAPEKDEIFLPYARCAIGARPFRAGRKP